jgi:hypothetical protein
MPKNKNPLLDEDFLSSLKEIIVGVVKEVGEKKSPPQEEIKASTTSKLDNMEIANGREKIKEVADLETILNTRSTNAFGTTEYAIYEERLKGMTVADMQALAQKVGVDPFLDILRLKEGLKAAFVSASKNFGGALRKAPKPVNRQLNPRNPEDLKVMQMLGMQTSR